MECFFFLLLEFTMQKPTLCESCRTKIFTQPDTELFEIFINFCPDGRLLLCRIADCSLTFKTNKDLFQHAQEAHPNVNYHENTIVILSKDIENCCKRNAIEWATTKQTNLERERVSSENKTDSGTELTQFSPKSTSIQTESHFPLCLRNSVSRDSPIDCEFLTTTHGVGKRKREDEHETRGCHSSGEPAFMNFRNINMTSGVLWNMLQNVPSAKQMMIENTSPVSSSVHNPQQNQYSSISPTSSERDQSDHQPSSVISSSSENITTNLNGAIQNFYFQSYYCPQVTGHHGNFLHQQINEDNVVVQEQLDHSDENPVTSGEGESHSGTSSGESRNNEPTQSRPNPPFREVSIRTCIAKVFNKADSNAVSELSNSEESVVNTDENTRKKLKYRERIDYGTTSSEDNKSNSLLFSSETCNTENCDHQSPVSDGELASQSNTDGESVASSKSSELESLPLSSRVDNNWTTELSGRNVRIRKQVKSSPLNSTEDELGENEKENEFMAESSAGQSGFLPMDEEQEVTLKHDDREDSSHGSSRKKRRRSKKRKNDGDDNWKKSKKR